MVFYFDFDEGMSFLPKEDYEAEKTSTKLAPLDTYLSDDYANYVPPPPVPEYTPEYVPDLNAGWEGGNTWTPPEPESTLYQPEPTYFTPAPPDPWSLPEYTPSSWEPPVTEEMFPSNDPYATLPQEPLRPYAPADRYRPEPATADEWDAILARPAYPNRQLGSRQDQWGYEPTQFASIGEQLTDYARSEDAANTFRLPGLTNFTRGMANTLDSAETRWRSQVYDPIVNPGGGFGGGPAYVDPAEKRKQQERLDMLERFEIGDSRREQLAEMFFKEETSDDALTQIAEPVMKAGMAFQKYGGGPAAMFFKDLLDYSGEYLGAGLKASARGQAVQPPDNPVGELVDDPAGYYRRLVEENERLLQATPTGNRILDAILVGAYYTATDPLSYIAPGSAAKVAGVVGARTESTLLRMAARTIGEFAEAGGPRLALAANVGSGVGVAALQEFGVWDDLDPDSQLLLQLGFGMGSMLAASPRVNFREVEGPIRPGLDERARIPEMTAYDQMPLALRVAFKMERALERGIEGAFNGLPSHLVFALPDTMAAITLRAAKAAGEAGDKIANGDAVLTGRIAFDYIHQGDLPGAGQLFVQALDDLGKAVKDGTFDVLRATRIVANAIGDQTLGRAIRFNEELNELSPTIQRGYTVEPQTVEVRPGETLFHGTNRTIEGELRASNFGGALSGAPMIYLTREASIANTAASGRAGNSMEGAQVLRVTPREELKLIAADQPLTAPERKVLREAALDELVEIARRRRLAKDIVLETGGKVIEAFNQWDAPAVEVLHFVHDALSPFGADAGALLTRAGYHGIDGDLRYLDPLVGLGLTPQAGSKLEPQHGPVIKPQGWDVRVDARRRGATPTGLKLETVPHRGRPIATVSARAREGFAKLWEQRSVVDGARKQVADEVGAVGAATGARLGIAAATTGVTYMAADEDDRLRWALLAAGLGSYGIIDGLTNGPAMRLISKGYKRPTEIPSAKRAATREIVKPTEIGFGLIVDPMVNPNVAYHPDDPNYLAARAKARATSTINADAAHKLQEVITDHHYDSIATKALNSFKDAFHFGSQNRQAWSIQRKFMEIVGDMKQGEEDAAHYFGTLKTYENQIYKDASARMMKIDVSPDALEHARELPSGVPEATRRRQMTLLLSDESDLRVLNAALSPGEIALVMQVRDYLKANGKALVDWGIISPEALGRNPNYISHIWQMLEGSEQNFITNGTSPVKSAWIEERRTYREWLAGVEAGHVPANLSVVDVGFRVAQIAQRRIAMERLLRFIDEQHQIGAGTLGQPFLTEVERNAYRKSEQLVQKLGDYKLMDAPALQSRQHKGTYNQLMRANLDIKDVIRDLRKAKRLSGYHGVEIAKAETQYRAWDKRLDAALSRLQDAQNKAADKAVTVDADEIRKVISERIDEVRTASAERAVAGKARQRMSKEMKEAAADAEQKVDNAVTELLQINVKLAEANAEILKASTTVTNLPQTIYDFAMKAKDQLEIITDQQQAARRILKDIKYASEYLEIKQAYEEALSEEMATLGVAKGEVASYAKRVKQATSEAALHRIEKIGELAGRIKEAELAVKHLEARITSHGGQKLAWMAEFDAAKARLDLLKAQRDNIRVDWDRQKEKLWVRNDYAPMFRWMQETPFTTGESFWRPYGKFFETVRETILSGYYDLYMTGVAFQTAAGMGIPLIGDLPMSVVKDAMLQAAKNSYPEGMIPAKILKVVGSIDFTNPDHRTYWQQDGTFTTYDGKVVKVHDVRLDGRRHGVGFSLDTSDFYSSLLEGNPKKTLAGHILPGKLGEHVERQVQNMTRAQFEGAVGTFKTIFYENLWRKFMENHPPEKLEEMKQRAAEVVNLRFGGKDFAMSGMNKGTMNALRVLLIAPNWFLTRMELFARTLDITHVLRTTEGWDRVQDEGIIKRYIAAVQTLSTGDYKAQQWALQSAVRGTTLAITGLATAITAKAALEGRLPNDDDTQYFLNELEHLLNPMDPHFLEFRDPFSGAFVGFLTWEKDLLRYFMAAQYLGQAATKSDEVAYEKAWESLGGYGKARLGILPRAVTDIVTDRNFTGRKISTAKRGYPKWLLDYAQQQAIQSQPQFLAEAEKALPIPFTGKTLGEKMGMGRSSIPGAILNTVGLGRQRAQTPLQRAFTGQQQQGEVTSFKFNPDTGVMESSPNMEARTYSELDPLSRREFIRRNKEENPEVIRYLRAGLPEGYSETVQEAEAHVNKAAEWALAGEDPEGNLYPFSAFRNAANAATQSKVIAGKIAFAETATRQEQEALNSWYATYDEVTRGDGSLDYDKLRVAQDAWQAEHSPEEFAYVQAYELLGKPEPLQQYIRARRLMQEIDYFGMDRFIHTKAWPAGLTEEQVVAYIDRADEASDLRYQGKQNPETRKDRIANWIMAHPEEYPKEHWGAIAAGLGDENPKYDNFKTYFPQLRIWLDQDVLYPNIVSMVENQWASDVYEQGYPNDFAMAAAIREYVLNGVGTPEAIMEMPSLWNQTYPK